MTQTPSRNPGREKRPNNPKVTLENAIACVALERSRADKAFQVLTGKLMEAQEEERRRIGRELHDGLNQELAMLAVELGLLTRQVPEGNSALIESIVNLRQRAEYLSEDLRHFSHQLHPAVLEHLGLHAALRSLCEDFIRYHEIRVWFGADPQTEGVSGELAICLYRISQEALRNVVRHSRAMEAWIRLSRTPHGIQMSIVDRGVGFDPNSPVTAGPGLISMKERVQFFRGHFYIESASNAGTEIRVTVPVTWKER